MSNSNQNLFGISVLFEKPEELFKAIELVKKEGYKNFDVHTPYPVHGLSDKLELKPSKIGIITFFSGTFFSLLFLYFIWWITTQNYPINYGGKPFFSFPAYIGLLFESTVLFGTLITFFILIAFIFKFPDTGNPLNESNYMKNISTDKFGIFIKESNIDINKIKLLFKNIKPNIEINHIYKKNKKPSIIFNPVFILFIISIGITSSWLTYAILNKLLFLKPFSNLNNQSSIKVQDNNFNDIYKLKLPLKNTVSQNSLPEFIRENPAIAEKYLINPYISEKDILEKGKQKYVTFCSPCHGNSGTGKDSKLKSYFPIPPSLISNKVRNWKDGRIFHIITYGQRIMPSYSSQITNEERWKIILYIRYLQNRDIKMESKTNE